jgi:hypothetical protein
MVQFTGIRKILLKQTAIIFDDCLVHAIPTRATPIL